MPSPSDAQPRVTMVVPSFEQGRFLPYCLRSLIAQTPLNLEVLVYDNESTDCTGDVLREFWGSLRRVTVERDNGQSAALNRGFKEARGEIVGWLNADDMLMPGAVRRAVQVLDATRADVVYGHCAHVDASGQFQEYFPFGREFDAIELQNYSGFMPQPAVFFRRSLLDRVGLLDEKLNFAMDWDLWCRFAKAGAQFHFVPEVWAAARIHEAAKTSRGGVSRLIEVLRVNLRHATLGVPMLFLLYLAHRAARLLTLNRFVSLRQRWHSLVGGDRTRVVHGVASGGYIAAWPARVTFPVFDEVARLCVNLGDARYAPARVTANGRTMTREGGDYVLRDPLGRVEALDICVADGACPLPARIAISHERPWSPT